MKIQNHPWSWGLLAGLAVWLVAIVATCSSCAPSQMRTQAGTPRAPQQQLSSAYDVTVICVLADGSGTVSGGSAVMIDTHHLLTALHVVTCDNGGVPIVTVNTEKGARLATFVQREWKDKDIAQLYTRFELPGADAKLGALPAIGTGVCAHHGSPTFGAACGEVSSLRPTTPEADIIVTAAIRPGNSGGGLYDSDGVLVGIVTVWIQCEPGKRDSCGGGASSVAGIR